MSLEYLSVVTISFWFLLTVRGKGPRSLVAASLSGPFVGKSCSSVFNFDNVPILCACTAPTDSCVYVVCHVRPEGFPLHGVVHPALTIVARYYRVV